MIENFRLECWFFAPTAHEFVPARISSDRHTCMRQAWNFEQQVSLLFVKASCPLIKIDSLFADLSYLCLQIVSRLAPRFFSAYLFAQSIPFRLQPLQFGLGFAPVGIDTQNFIYRRFIAAATRSQSLANKIRLFTAQTNVEHGAIVSAAAPGGTWLG